jgi:hypothetical protein
MPLRHLPKLEVAAPWPSQNETPASRMVTVQAGTVSVVRPAAAELQGAAVAESTET